MAKVLRHIKAVQVFFLILGLAIFFYVISRVGLAQIVDSIKLMGYGFIALMALSAFRHWIRSVAWLHCIEEDHRNIRIFDLFNIRLAGDAVRLLSFTGPLLGETSKAVLIRKRLPMVHGMSSIIIENLAYTIAVIFIVVSGIALLIVNFATGTSLRVMSAVLTVCMVGGVFGIHYIASRRIKIAARLGGWIAGKTDSKSFKDRSHAIGRTEDKIHNFYKRRGSRLYFVLFLEFVANIVNVLEVYVILFFIGTSASYLSAYIIEAMMKVVNILFFFVPGQVGVMEGGNAILLNMLGLGASAGVTLSLIEKIKAIFWAGYGLMVWLVAFRKKRVGSSKEDHSERSGLNRANSVAMTEQ